MLDQAEGGFFFQSTKPTMPSTAEEIDSGTIKNQYGGALIS